MSEPTALGRWLPTPFLKLSAALHVGAAAALAVWPQHWPWTLGAVFSDHLLTLAGSTWPRSALLGPNVRRLPGAEAGSDRVGLTFDDGPDPQVTPGVLSILEERGCTATFFCIGRKAERHPDLVGEIVKRGHRVENHSFGHSNGFSLLPPGAQGRDLDRAQQLLGDLTGRTPLYFRAPAGVRSPWTEPLLAVRGLRLASWSRRAFDTVARDATTVARRLTSSLGGGEILLMHDGSSARDASGRPVVLDALPRVLDRLSESGLQPVPLPVVEFE